MINENTISLLREKITELRTALFFSEHNALLKMHAALITCLEVDNTGQVWFFLGKPQQELHLFDKTFPARMDFFKKGANYHIKISGLAIITEDAEQAEAIKDRIPEIKTINPDKYILVKLKITKAECSEYRAKPQQGLTAILINRIHQFIFSAREVHQYSLDLKEVG